MPPEPKGIERRWTLWRWTTGARIWMVDIGLISDEDTERVEVMPVEDHLAVLGEAIGERDDQKAAADEACTELANIRALFDGAPTEALNLVRDLKSRANGRKERVEQLEGSVNLVAKQRDGWRADYDRLQLEWDSLDNRVGGLMRELRAAEEHLRAEEQHRLETQRECIAAKQQLQGLREAAKSEVERLRRSALCNGGGMEPYLDGCASTAEEVADRLQALLDTYSVDEGGK